MKLTTLALSMTIGFVTIPALAIADEPMPPMSGMASGQSVDAVDSTGVITAIDPESRKVTLSHESIPELKWPRMTMGFPVDPGVNMEAVSKGDSVAFTLTPTKSGQKVTRIEKQ
ncbi:copper-binding protein [Marinobacter sp.]|uniref:copper-binding protein n=1 Tax=Marinobacter sp. TaxID=50741 RepID=UPI001B69755F|nr:copper-binding protein [Marinobacter sp.]MBQ0834738.1 copper-binding protein [Marinobacter sp.]